MPLTTRIPVCNQRDKGNFIEIGASNPSPIPLERRMQLGSSISVTYVIIHLLQMLEEPIKGFGRLKILVARRRGPEGSSLLPV